MATHTFKFNTDNSRIPVSVTLGVLYAVLLGFCLCVYSAVYADSEDAAEAELTGYSEQLKTWLETPHESINNLSLTEFSELCLHAVEAIAVVVREDVQAAWTWFMSVLAKQDITDWSSLRDELPYVLIDAWQPALWGEVLLARTTTQPLETLVLLLVLTPFMLYFLGTFNNTKESRKRIMPMLRLGGPEDDTMLDSADGLGVPAHAESAPTYTPSTPEPTYTPSTPEPTYTPSTPAAAPVPTQNPPSVASSETTLDADAKPAQSDSEDAEVALNRARIYMDVPGHRQTAIELLQKVVHSGDENLRERAKEMLQSLDNK